MIPKKKNAQLRATAPAPNRARTARSAVPTRAVVATPHYPTATAS